MASKSPVYMSHFIIVQSGPGLRLGAVMPCSASFYILASLGGGDREFTAALRATLQLVELLVASRTGGRRGLQRWAKSVATCCTMKYRTKGRGMDGALKGRTLRRL